MPAFKNLSKILCLFIIAFYAVACSKVNDLEINIDDTISANATAELTVIRTGTGSGEWDMNDNDGFNYYFTSYPTGAFEVEVVDGKTNDYCHTSESNVVTDRIMRNELKRELLVKEKNKGEITIAIACHKNIYRFNATDSIVSVQMVVEDSRDKVRDTTVFNIIRRSPL